VVLDDCYIHEQIVTVCYRLRQDDANNWVRDQLSTRSDVTDTGGCEWAVYDAATTNSFNEPQFRTVSEMSPFTYSQIPYSQTRNNSTFIVVYSWLQLRSANDPWVFLQGLTDGKLNFGQSRADRQKSGVTVIVIGLILTAIMGSIVCCFTSSWRKGRNNYGAQSYQQHSMVQPQYAMNPNQSQIPMQNGQVMLVNPAQPMMMNNNNMNTTNSTSSGQMPMMMAPQQPMLYQMPAQMMNMQQQQQQQPVQFYGNPNTMNMNTTTMSMNANTTSGGEGVQQPYNPSAPPPY
jgi:hypothetical protein